MLIYNVPDEFITQAIGIIYCIKNLTYMEGYRGYTLDKCSYYLGRSYYLYHFYLFYYFYLFIYLFIWVCFSLHCLCVLNLGVFVLS